MLLILKVRNVLFFDVFSWFCDFESRLSIICRGAICYATKNFASEMQGVVLQVIRYLLD